MPDRADDARSMADALRYLPTAFVALEVRWVLIDHVDPVDPVDTGDVLVQVVYELGTRATGGPTLATVHHSRIPLPAPSTYERVRSDAPLLRPAEVGHDLPRHRGLRWLPRGDPAGRAWAVGRRLVTLVGDEDAGRLLAGHFAVPLVLDGRPPVRGPSTARSVSRGVSGQED